MKYQNKTIYLNTAIEILKNNLKDKTKIDVNIKIDNVWAIIKISNFYFKYQTKAIDLILIETKSMAFVVSKRDANFTVRA